jgi:hypothetical protein
MGNEFFDNFNTGTSQPEGAAPATAPEAAATPEVEAQPALGPSDTFSSLLESLSNYETETPPAEAGSNEAGDAPAAEAQPPADAATPGEPGATPPADAPAAEAAPAPTDYVGEYGEDIVRSGVEVMANYLNPNVETRDIFNSLATVSPERTFEVIALGLRHYADDFLPALFGDGATAEAIAEALEATGGQDAARIQKALSVLDTVEQRYAAGDTLDDDEALEALLETDAPRRADQNAPTPREQQLMHELQGLREAVGGIQSKAVQEAVDQSVAAYRERVDAPITETLAKVDFKPVNEFLSRVAGIPIDLGELLAAKARNMLISDPKFGWQYEAGLQAVFDEIKRTSAADPKNVRAVALERNAALMKVLPALHNRQQRNVAALAKAFGEMAKLVAGVNQQRTDAVKDEPRIVGSASGSDARGDAVDAFQQLQEQMSRTGGNPFEAVRSM